MKKLKIKDLFFLIFLLIVIFLSKRYIYLKELGFREIPNSTDILDERSYIWAAKSFLQTRVPTSWSNLASYLKNRERKEVGLKGISIEYKYQKPSLKNVKYFDYPIVAVADIDVGKGMEQILMVQPFIDHSFSSGLIFGLKTPNNLKSFVLVKPEQYRSMAILVSLATGFLIFVLGTLIYEPVTGLFSFLIYSSVAVYILSSRYALAENVLVPLTILTLIFLAIYDKLKLENRNWSKLVLILSGIFAGWAVANKESGFAAVLMGLLILYFKHHLKFRQIFWFFVPAVLVGLSFYLYAFCLTPSLFISVFRENAGRGFFGPLNFFFSIISLRFSDFPLDGYWLFGFMALLWASSKFKENFEILIGFLSFLLIFLVWGGINYPWYSLIFIPFLVIASGKYIKELLVNPEPLKLSLFFLFPFSTSIFWGRHVYHSLASNIIFYRGAIILFLGLEVLTIWKRENKLIMIGISLVILLIFLKMLQWNRYGFEYIIANWGKLPNPFMLEQ